MPEILSLENSIGYSFTDRSLAVAALSHSSTAKKPQPMGLNSETLEFLGDAVLGLVIGHELMRRRPDLREGELSRWRSSLVSRDALAKVALEIHLDEHLRLGAAEINSGGQTKPSILAHAVEAIIGAIYKDGGFVAAERAILEFFAGALDAGFLPHEFDPKTCLQEWAQSKGQRPEYRLLDQRGASHAMSFRMEAVVAGKILGAGSGPSKKRASIAAARDALQFLQKDGIFDDSVASWNSRLGGQACVD